jgi:hypothetical protein
MVFFTDVLPLVCILVGQQALIDVVDRVFFPQHRARALAEAAATATASSPAHADDVASWDTSGRVVPAKESVELQLLPSEDEDSD